MDKKALYGTIDYSGGWHVTFEAENNRTCELSGYGEFPYSRFPDIFVINFKNDNKVFDYLKAAKNDVMPSESNPRYTGSMDTFMELINDLGIMVIYPLNYVI